MGIVLCVHIHGVGQPSSFLFDSFSFLSHLLLSQQKKSEGEGDEILEELQKKQSELNAVVSSSPC